MALCARRCVTSEKSGEDQDRDNLIEQYQKFVNRVVSTMIKSMSLPSEMYDEFVAAGNLGLVEAAQRYDPNQGQNFRAYAYLRIRGAIIDSIRECSDLIGRAYKYSRALQAAHDVRESSFLLDVDTRNLPPGDPTETLLELLEYASKGALCFRLSMIEAEEEVQSVSDDQPILEDALIDREANLKLRALIKKLPAKERKIIEAYYYKNRSFHEIAKRYKGMSKSWVSRLHTRALIMLKELYINEQSAE